MSSRTRYAIPALVLTMFWATPIIYAQGGGSKDEVKNILKKYDCNKCHTQSMRLVGPAFNAVAKRNYSKERIVELIMNPEPKNWPGYGEMPKIDTLRRDDVEKVAEWIVSLKKD